MSESDIKSREVSREESSQADDSPQNIDETVKSVGAILSKSIEQISKVPEEKEDLAELEERKRKANERRAELRCKIFTAITDLVNDLWEVFGTKRKKGQKAKIPPLSLYHRLLSNMEIPKDPQQIDESVAKAMDDAIFGFRDFLIKYGKEISEDKLDVIPNGTNIYYGASKIIYLEIQRFIHKSSDDVKKTISAHLLTIYTLMDPNQKRLEDLEKRISDLQIDTSTKEGEFVTTILNKTKTTMDGMGDVSNPATAIMGLFSSGIIQDMFSGLQQGVNDKSINMKKLFGTMQNAMNSMIGDVDDDEKVKPPSMAVAAKKK